MARTRSTATQLAHLLSATSQPVYALDDRRQIVYCNAACAEWLGLDPQQLVGRRCDYHAGDGAEAAETAAARLCPPPEVFALLDEPARPELAVTARLVSPQATASRDATFLPLVGDSDEHVGVAVIVAAEDGPARQPAALDEVDSAELHERLRILASAMRGKYQLDRLVGESAAIQRVRRQVEAATETTATVLVIGPRGSGREHVARTIHQAKIGAAGGPLMPLSCASLDAELLQTTVLAFLRRVQSSEASATLLLLDVDQLDAEAQAELLAFFRVPTFELRTIVTTRRPLLQLAGEGEFVNELAQALSTLVIDLPPLADRRSDIPFLAQQFLEQYNAAGGKQLQGFSHAVLDRLCSLPWPGNVSELADVVRAMCEGAEAVTITEADYPDRVRWLESAAAHPPPAPPESIELDAFLVDVERELIERALREAQGNKAQAARLLGISRPRLLRRISQLEQE